ncbi:hypothetical protein F7725_010814 [Dissostichus mawsoni]|uniref:Uncharacterized protein n=1 Tax=Dissostichus mawsoni TaxID=36200 RepID=A0A7J5Z7V2_DISMA|nr:hypothetical protein F7725_010814 [Dissostichus mawsoni]
MRSDRDEVRQDESERMRSDRMMRSERDEVREMMRVLVFPVTVGSQHSRTQQSLSLQQRRSADPLVSFLQTDSHTLSHTLTHTMRTSWISVCGLLAAVCAVQATHTFYSTVRCDCNGRSRYCLRDGGLHCVDCQGHLRVLSVPRVTAGGAAAAKRHHRKQIRQPRQDSGNCFCYGHSSRCSAKTGYSVHNITSTFASGPDGWRAATARGDTPPDVHFRWSPKHQDLEVISKNSLPVYLYAPARYLGNRLLSYGQNFSFSLRLDRGVRHPSVSDVILEGNGLKVTASLGELRSIVPCGQKVHYSFRISPPSKSGSRSERMLDICVKFIWVSKLFPGRGYLNNVRLVSARRGAGPPAGWVQTCSCPTGYDGDFCDGCSAGFRRSAPADGAFSPCEPCSCRGGAATRSPGTATLGTSRPETALPGPTETRGPKSLREVPLSGGKVLLAGCWEGFYGGAARGDGVSTQTCRPCQCNGHIDVSVTGSCDRGSGECLKCVNNTKGPSCESCLRGFYHSRAADACKACDCSVLGSESGQCDDSGRCRCRPGFEGLRCQRSNCPACFTPIKTKMQAYAAKLAELERLFSEMDAGLKPANKAEMEAALNAVEELVDDLQYETEGLTVEEKKLQARLASISRSQLDEEQEIQNVANAADDIEQQERTYSAKVKEVQALVEDMKRKLDKAKSDLRSAEIPQGDAPLGTTLLSSLTTADSVERTANEALIDSKKSLALIRDLMTRENKVQELIGDMKTIDQAKDESKTSDGMLKDIANMERSIPADLKGQVDAMVSRLDDVKVEVDAHISGLDALQDTIDDSKSLADDAIKRLPGINATIQQAVSNNAETSGILGDVSADYDSSDLKQQTLDATDNLTSELEDGRTLENEAEQKHQRRRVETLRDINALLAKMDQSTPVDETQLRALEVALEGAQQEVQGRLRPRLRDMEAGEEAYRRRLSGINRDIDSITNDITNLKVILAAVPSGCYNSPPIEEA